MKINQLVYVLFLISCLYIVSASKLNKLVKRQFFTGSTGVNNIVANITANSSLQLPPLPQQPKILEQLTNNNNKKVKRQFFTGSIGVNSRVTNITIGSPAQSPPPVLANWQQLVPQQQQQPAPAPAPAPVLQQSQVLEQPTRIVQLQQPQIGIQTSNQEQDNNNILPKSSSEFSKIFGKNNQFDTIMVSYVQPTTTLQNNVEVSTTTTAKPQTSNKPVQAPIFSIPYIPFSDQRNNYIVMSGDGSINSYISTGAGVQPIIPQLPIIPPIPILPQLPMFMLPTPFVDQRNNYITGSGKKGVDCDAFGQRCNYYV